MTAHEALRNGVIIEIIRLLAGFILLAVTWSVGQRILAKSELWRKRREIDITLSLDFQQRFGEFKAIWRRWKAYIEANRGTQLGRAISPLDQLRWSLFTEATTAEAKLEAAFVKLATERRLSPDDLQCLGLFRQAYQELREAIRDGIPMSYKHDHPRYAFYNAYGGRVAHIIVRARKYDEPSLQEAESNLLAIQVPRRDDWIAAVATFARERGLKFPEESPSSSPS